MGGLGGGAGRARRGCGGVGSKGGGVEDDEAKVLGGGLW
jgi:hypothetical protein